MRTWNEGLFELKSIQVLKSLNLFANGSTGTSEVITPFKWFTALHASNKKWYGPYPQWRFVMSQNKYCRDSWGSFVRFLWITMERNFFSDHISAKEEDIKL